jgi:adenylate kinase
MNKYIIIFGPQGSGKGTQAERIAEHYALPGFSMGQLLRDASKEDSEQGRFLKQQLTEGTLTPEHITNGLLFERLQEDDTKGGFIIDGFPRNDVQENAFREMLPKTHGGIAVTHAVVLELSDEEAINRLSGRRTCSGCGNVYHLVYNPPKDADVCDECGGELIQRKDDKPEAIKIRLSIYHDKTEPLLKRYMEDGVLHRVDAHGTIEEVFRRIIETIRE